MATKDDALNLLRQLPQNELKEVLAAGILLVENPEKGIGTALFESGFHLFPQSCVELVIVDKIGMPTKFLITRRAANDPTYPNRLHCPGSYIRLGETSLQAMTRCVKRELGDNIEIVDYIPTTPYNNSVSCAGDEIPATGRQHHTVGLVHRVQISGEPTRNVERKWTRFIPSDLLRGHQDFVRDALGWEKTNRPLFE